MIFGLTPSLAGVLAILASRLLLESSALTQEYEYDGVVPVSLSLLVSAILSAIVFPLFVMLFAKLAPALSPVTPKSVPTAPVIVSENVRRIASILLSVSLS